MSGIVKALIELVIIIAVMVFLYDYYKRENQQISDFEHVLDSGNYTQEQAQLQYLLKK